MPPTVSTIRRIQLLQSEIAELRRQNVLLRGALADIVTMADIARCRAYALKTLTDLPAPRSPPPPPPASRPAPRPAAVNPPADDDAIGDGDVGAAGRSSGG